MLNIPPWESVTTEVTHENEIATLTISIHTAS